jgi:HSP20 family molecular chaperone IbpA
MEISYSHFERTFELPCDLDRCGISTDSRDGMLHIHITETEK